MPSERSKNREESKSVEPQGRGQLFRMEPWPAFSPFSMMRRFATEMDRMFEGWGVQGGEHFSPQIDIFERDGKLVIRADMPGLSKDDVKIDITEDAIILEGERRFEHEEQQEGIYKAERSYGQFRRQIPIPEYAK